MRGVLAAGVAVLALAGPAAAADHRCAQDVLQRAARLLALHYEVEADAPQIFVDAESLETLPPVKALAGTGSFDVVEVYGYIYKAEYRMRFIYAQIPDSCVLMGQEILEASDPY